jgi:hypothetical protein
MDKKKDRVILEKNEVVVDHNTGEILKSTTENTIVLPKEPDFVKLYLSHITHLTNLPNWTNPILHEFLAIMNYQNEIILNSAIKKRIAKKLGVQMGSIDNAIQHYVKKMVLTRIEIGIYRANPFIFGKGEWKNIRGIRIQLSYDFEKLLQKFESEFTYREDED